MFGKKTIALLAASAALISGTAYLCAPGKANEEQKKQMNGRNYAHRGLHTEDRTIPENSLEAFEAAADKGYGIELDVRLTKDGRVVVFHDDTLERVCGINKRVDELTYAELKELKLYGTEQTIPQFVQVLETVNGRSPLIVELKPGKDRIELCEKTKAILAEYKGEACIESFDPFVVAWFRKNSPNTVRGQLSMPMKMYKGMNPMLKFMLSRCLFNCITRPHFIAYKIGLRPLAVHFSELMGAMKVGWTSHEVKNEDKRNAVIFEFYNPEVRFR